MKPFSSDEEVIPLYSDANEASELQISDVSTARAWLISEVPSRMHLPPNLEERLV